MQATTLAKTIPTCVERNNAGHICAMKELRGEMAQVKEDVQQNLWADIGRLTSLVMQLAARSPKQNVEESSRVPFQQYKEESEDGAKPPPRSTKKIKTGKVYKSGMEYDIEWEEATKKAWRAACKVHYKKHPNSMEVK